MCISLKVPLTIFPGSFSWHRKQVRLQEVQPFALCSTSVPSMPKPAPWTAAKEASFSCTYNTLHFLTDCKLLLPCTLTHTGKHKNSTLLCVHCKFRRWVLPWNRGFLWPSLLDWHTMIHCLLHFLGSETGLFIWSAYSELYECEDLESFNWANPQWSTEQTELPANFASLGNARVRASIPNLTTNFKLSVLIWGEIGRMKKDIGIMLDITVDLLHFL